VIISKEKSILIIAPSLLAESLSLNLTSLDNNLRISFDINNKDFLPELVIWNILNYQSEDLIRLELLKLKEKWIDSKILIIYSGKFYEEERTPPILNSEGLLLNPSSDKVLKSINTILNGGRVFDIKNNKEEIKTIKNKKLSFNQKLLSSGLKQIDHEINTLMKYINKDITPFVYRFILKGRLRELVTAKSLLIFLWGSSLDIYNENLFTKDNNSSFSIENSTIFIKEKDNLEIWRLILGRLINKYSNNSIEIDLNKSTLILSGLKNEFISRIICNTLTEVDKLINNIKNNYTDETYKDDIYILLNQLKKNTLINITDSYMRLKRDGTSLSFNDFIFKEFEDINNYDDIESHNIFTFIDPIINNEPLSYDGKLLPLYETESFIIFEEIISNWVIRSSNLLSADIFNYCSGWPELRYLFINNNLQSTRSYERFRNNINNYDRWHNNIYMPIYLYESKREYIDIIDNNFVRYFKNENRENDLKNLQWFQKQITLLIEIRDALAPQLEIAIKYIGDIFVTILTKIIGNAIGLVGKGILQGLGRTNSK
tara:strand:+ start:2328 stop:3959 length:1632 start_codon:yes stop_codon:yes gene_type:complete